MRKFSAGGFQRHFPQNEAQLYMAKFTMDVASYCFNDYSSSGLNDSEVECAKRLVSLNNQLINQN
eukprot:CAMPEP_0170518732 /NCGR_PEP_ID=MMETSP0209-20121228/4353_1 /TAXON_ID=665100 ORGANISM="Litonotus pictus, Strain P1" /NCGR_SAMPLE_ID=MMETSP0209 /ASSEMBLY_ACC=CAM_ASM_000301 /LENGTH=64 /DNA_ID=CAMNT_0010804393 /DNA_START=26 /DNA_END=220 /DNA_ORIENTATION=-